MAFKDIDSLLPKVHVLSSVCNYSKLFSELWVKTYVDRAVTFYPSDRVKSNNEVGKKEHASSARRKIIINTKK